MTSLIGTYFGRSQPGDELHHLVLARPGRNALGLPDLTRPQIAVYALAPANPAEPPEQFIGRSVLAAVAQELNQGPLWGAVLTLEQHHVHALGDEVAENRARRMAHDQQLEQHPDAVEATVLYAACADARRWHGNHWLTGPRAGTIDGPHLLSRGPDPERDGGSLARVIRHAVGIRW
jgi:hypothetical protein